MPLRQLLINHNRKVLTTFMRNIKSCTTFIVLLFSQQNVSKIAPKSMPYINIDV